MSIYDRLKAMRPYDHFEYWFIRIARDSWRVVDKSRKPVCILLETTGSSTEGVTCSQWLNEEDSAALVDVAADFNLFRDTRPEYWVGAKVDPEGKPIEWATNVYSMIIAGLALLRSYENKAANIDAAAEKILTCLEWLDNSGFYYGPSSTQYHESFQGGNLFHHLKVIDTISDLITLPQFEGKVKWSSAILVAATHDWCKIDAYESYTKKLPDERGNWVPTQCWKYKDVMLPLGHGVASMMHARRFFALTQEEMVAIRWHMGAWRVVDSEMNELQQANENFPLVHLLQFADQLAIVNY